MGEGVKRTGVYLLTPGRKITIKMLMAAAGVIGEQKDLAVILVRRGPSAQDTRQTILLALQRYPLSGERARREFLAARLRAW
jgi:hypothetical protein